MHYEIHRGLKSGQSLNTAQRTSSLFAEEPVVLGKVFRRGYPPIVLTETQFELNKTHLTRLEKAGAIVIKKQGVQEAVQPSVPLQDPPPPPPPENPPAEPPAPEPIKAEEVAHEAAPALEVVKEVVAEVVPEEVVDAPKSKKGKNK